MSKYTIKIFDKICQYCELLMTKKANLVVKNLTYKKESILP